MKHVQSHSLEQKRILRLPWVSTSHLQIGTNPKLGQIYAFGEAVGNRHLAHTSSEYKRLQTVNEGHLATPTKVTNALWQNNAFGSQTDVTYLFMLQKEYCPVFFKDFIWQRVRGSTSTEGGRQREREKPAARWAGSLRGARPQDAGIITEPKADI